MDCTYFWRDSYLKPLWSTGGAPMHIGSALAGFKKAFEAYIYRMRPASSKSAQTKNHRCTLLEPDLKQPGQNSVS